MPPGSAPSEQSISPPKSKYAKLVAYLLKGMDVPCEFRFASGDVLRFGSTAPKFTVTFNNDKVLTASISQSRLAHAYITGELDVEGDIFSMLEIRRYIKERMGFLHHLKFWFPFFLLKPVSINKKAIADHYSYGDDFFCSFMDNKYHLYTHCLFPRADATLEEAAEHKMETIWKTLQLKPGMRVLDIGAGWGPMMRYAAPRGAHVTGLTLTEDSYRLHKELIAAHSFENCEILLEDFLLHKPAEPYDAIVILGVIEHLPYYRRFAERVWDCLKPGGRMYLDGVASVNKYNNFTPFVRTYVFPGNHALMQLPGVIHELLLHGLGVLEVVDETPHYERTVTHWAQRLEDNRELIEKRWGTPVFRAFLLYLKGGAWWMRNDKMSCAYRILAQKGPNPGLRPGLFKRIRNFIQSLK